MLVNSDRNLCFCQIAPSHLGVDQPHLSESDPTKLAELVLANAVKMKCRKFVRAKDIVKGNAKLNLAFVCNLFNNFPALEPAEEELPNLEETREEKTFRNWMNSMGVKPFVQNLFLDLDDGCVLLQLFELVKYSLLAIVTLSYTHLGSAPVSFGVNVLKSARTRFRLCKVS